MSSKDSGVRVRFAPSPTGMVHIGNLRTAVFNWLFAKHNDGSFLVRVEDTDLERSEDQYKDVIFEVLDWMDLKPDEPVVYQSKNIDRHNQLIQQMLDSGKAYKCFCATKKEGDSSFAKYDGACRDKQDQTGSYVIRFKLPDDLPATLESDDLVHGKVTIPSDQLDDFIIVRSDGSPTYNFVVVVDDHDMGITHVIRGDDHFTNTYKQALLYKALGFEPPKFAHIPMILNEQGAKLSKRDAVVSALDYRNLGYLPDALFNYLVRLGWSSGDQEVFSRDELVKLFTLKNVQKSGAAFDKKKLDWLSGLYIREMTAEKLFGLVKPNLEPGFLSDSDILKLIALYKERSSSLKELAQFINKFNQQPDSYDQQSMAKWVQPETKGHLESLKGIFEALSIWNQDEISSALKAYAKENSLKLGALAQPLRLSVTGGTESPSIFALLELLGQKRSIDRLIRFLGVL